MASQSGSNMLLTGRGPPLTSLTDRQVDRQMGITVSELCDDDVGSV